MRTLHSEKIENIAKAATSALGLLDNSRKNKKAYSYNYADLGSIIEGSREILASNGLHIKNLMDFEVSESGQITHILVTELMHESGEYYRSYYPVIGVDLKGQNYHQQMGSAITYARRYSIAAMLNIAQVDDDAQGAGTPRMTTVQKLSSQQKTQGSIKSGNPPTEKQLSFLKKLVTENGYTFEHYMKSKGVSNESELSFDVVSRSIETLTANKNK